MNPFWTMAMDNLTEPEICLTDPLHSDFLSPAGSAMPLGLPDLQLSVIETSLWLQELDLAFTYPPFLPDSLAPTGTAGDHAHHREDLELPSESTQSAEPNSPSSTVFEEDFSDISLMDIDEFHLDEVQQVEEIFQTTSSADGQTSDYFQGQEMEPVPSGSILNSNRPLMTNSFRYSHWNTEILLNSHLSTQTPYAGCRSRALGSTKIDSRHICSLPPIPMSHYNPAAEDSIVVHTKPCLPTLDFCSNSENLARAFPNVLAAKKIARTFGKAKAVLSRGKPRFQTTPPSYQNAMQKKTANHFPCPTPISKTHNRTGTPTSSDDPNLESTLENLVDSTRKLLDMLKEQQETYANHLNVD